VAKCRCRPYGGCNLGSINLTRFVQEPSGQHAKLDLTRAILTSIRDTAYLSSIEIARKKGAFPDVEKIRYGASPFVQGLSHELQDGIAEHGIRNSHLLAVAPAGAISLLANNVSSGIAPICAATATRSVRGADGQPVSFEVEDAAVRQFRQLHDARAVLLAQLVTVADISAEDPLRMMAVVMLVFQKFSGVLVVGKAVAA